MRALVMLATAALMASTALGCTSRGEPACGLDYGECDALHTCAEGASCEALDWEHGRGEICRRSCQDELDCPRSGGRGGRCIAVNRAGDFQCYQDCVSEGECPRDWVCQPIRSGGVISGICLP